MILLSINMTNDVTFGKILTEFEQHPTAIHSQTDIYLNNDQLYVPHLGFRMHWISCIGIILLYRCNKENKPEFIKLAVNACFFFLTIRIILILLPSASHLRLNNLLKSPWLKTMSYHLLSLMNDYGKYIREYWTIWR